MASSCLMCGMEIPDNIMNSHLGAVHKHDPYFRVNCDFPGCGRTYTIWKSYRQHNWRKHGRNIQYVIAAAQHDSEDSNHPVDVDEILPHDDVDFDDDYNLQPHQQAPQGLLTPAMKLAYHSALFAGNLRENLLIPQTTVEAVVEGTTKLFEDFLNIVKASLLGEDENEENISKEDIKQVFEGLDPSSIFKLCGTSYSLKTFMENKLNLVKPVKTTLGKRWVWSQSRKLVMSERFAYVVPFLESLQMCLNNPEVLTCVDNPLRHVDGVLRTVTDGQYYRSHLVFEIDGKALSILVYEDDVQFAAPLGTKNYKLAMFYWVLLNIHPQFRSSLRVHNLLAIATGKDLKTFGPKPILEGFINDMRRLGQQEGVTLKVNGVDRVFHGVLNVVSGDSPAAGFLGGFKEGVGGAAHPCRRCFATQDDVKNNFDIHTFILRDAETHANQLNNLLNENLSPRAKTFWSKEYGINSRSCLLDIGNIDITTCMPHDFMHIVLEGVLESHVTYFIRHCIDQRLFTLHDFNNSLINFNYMRFTKDKPSPIEPAHLQNGIRQNATQMLALGQTLPFIVGQWLDESVEDHLRNFILLMQIINVSLAYVLHVEDADLLNLMVRIHHTRFKEMYGDAGITPKWHNMLHLGEQIILFGLPRQTWCMRCEGVHSYFKKVASRLRSFKNLPFSLASRRQQQQCVLLAVPPGGVSRSFLYYGDKVSSGVSKQLRDYVHRDLVRNTLPEIPKDTHVFLC